MTKLDAARIDPTAVPALFARLRVRPVAGHWAVGDDCCCLAVALIGAARSPGWNGEVSGREYAMRVGALWETEKGSPRMGGAATRTARAVGIHEDYAIGLIYGWDNRYPYPSRMHTAEHTRRVRAGWDDGRDAALACGLDPVPVDFPEGVTAPSEVDPKYLAWCARLDAWIAAGRPGEFKDFSRPDDLGTVMCG